MNPETSTCSAHGCSLESVHRLQIRKPSRPRTSLQRKGSTAAVKRPGSISPPALFRSAAGDDTHGLPNTWTQGACGGERPNALVRYESKWTLPAGMGDSSNSWKAFAVWPLLIFKVMSHGRAPAFRASQILIQTFCPGGHLVILSPEAGRGFQLEMPAAASTSRSSRMTPVIPSSFARFLTIRSTMREYSRAMSSRKDSSRSHPRSASSCRFSTSITGSFLNVLSPSSARVPFSRLMAAAAMRASSSCRHLRKVGWFCQM